MSFPSPGHGLVHSKPVLLAFYVLVLLCNFIFFIFRLLGLTHLLEYDLPPTSNASDRIQQTGYDQSLSAMLIRDILPAVHFRDLNCTEKVTDECVICLCEFDEDEEIRRLSNCRHLFHRNCLDRWLDCYKETCPLCRTHLVPDEMREEFMERLWAGDEHHALYMDGVDLSTWHDDSYF